MKQYLDTGIILLTFSLLVIGCGSEKTNTPTETAIHLNTETATEEVTEEIIATEISDVTEVTEVAEETSDSHSTTTTTTTQTSSTTTDTTTTTTTSSDGTVTGTYPDGSTYTETSFNNGYYDITARTNSDGSTTYIWYDDNQGECFGWDYPKYCKGRYTSTSDVDNLYTDAEWDGLVAAYSGESTSYNVQTVTVATTDVSTTRDKLYQDGAISKWREHSDGTSTIYYYNKF